MAQLQVKPQAGEETILPRRQYRIQYKPAWAAQWRDLDYMRLESCSQAAAPTMPRAVLTWLSGEIKHEDQTEFYTERALDLKDWFIRVIVLADKAAQSPAEPQKPGAKPKGQPLGVYVIPEEALRIGGDANAPLGDQQMAAYGLEYLLDRRAVDTIWVETADASGVEVAVTVPMNEKFERSVSEIGNRSENKITTNVNAGKTDGNGLALPPRSVTAHVFSRDGKAWNARQFVEYLLAYHGDGEVEFTLGGQAQALEQLVLPKFEFGGMTIYQILNKLIDRRRGLGWCVRVGEQSAKPEIHVFTTTDVPIAVGDVRVPANAQRVTLDLARQRRLGDVELTVDSLSRYGKIVVTGERFLVMFSLSKKDGTLVPAWTAAEETSYKNGAGATVDDESNQGKNDAERSRDGYRHVFTTFRTPFDWDWKAGDGEGGTKHAVNIASDANANVTTFRQGASAGTMRTGPYRNWGHRVLGLLPVLKEQADSDFDKEREFREVVAFLYDAQHARWVYADRAGEASKKHPSLAVRPMDKALGVELRSSYNHVLALNHWANAKPSGLTPTSETAFDWEKMIATVAVRTDQRLKVEVNLPYQTWAGEDPDTAAAKAKRLASRVLQIYVPGAELWYCVPNTVVDVVGGKLKRRNADSLKVDPAAGLRIRDDSGELRKIAALAKIWYGKPRAAVTVVFNELEFGYPVGAYVAAAQNAWQYEPINSPVTEKVFNFGPQMTTTLRTNFAELDVVGMSGTEGRWASGI